jgi:iron complex outermembrane receptor protein
VAGAALERDAYRPQDLPRFAYTFTVPGVFAQDDIDLATWLSLSVSGRVDHHSTYGTFVSPRVSALVRNGSWTSRVSLGTGFFGPFTAHRRNGSGWPHTADDSTPASRGERASTSLDVSRTDGPLSYTLTLFGSRIAHPIDVDRSAGLVLTNRLEPTTNVGIEALGTFRAEPYAVTATYTYVRAREDDDGMRRRRRSRRVIQPVSSACGSAEDVGRVGVELYYTGVQRLEENPFASGVGRTRSSGCSRSGNSGGCVCS